MFKRSQFDVFISHNSKDKPAVIQLAKKLKAQGLKVWLDIWELRPGHSWQEEVEKIIASTRAAVVLVGRDGFGPWQEAEMQALLQEFTQRKLPVIPVLLPGCRTQPKLPLFLHRLTWVDARKGLDEQVIKRLAWGITGRKWQEPDEQIVAEPSHSKTFREWRFTAAIVVTLISTIIITYHQYRFNANSPSRTLDVPEIEMISLPGGEFVMGSDKNISPDAKDDESPSQPLKIRPFLLGKYEVTQEQWRSIMGDNPSVFSQCGDDCPVDNVSLLSVKRFIETLNDLKKMNYRLPTEAEWEYACRSGGKEQEYCGGNDADAIAWYTGNSSGHPFHRGQKQANALGLCDLSGNVWEWTCSLYTERYDGHEMECVDGERKVNLAIRGGAWATDREALRSGNRGQFPSNITRSFLGFRLAHDIQ